MITRILWEHTTLPVLRKPQWEQFAQLLAKGESASRAYVIVGYRESEQNAHRLSKNGLVLKRIDEILTRKDQEFARAEVRAANAAKVDKKWVLDRLVMNVESGMEIGDRSGAVRGLELIGKELGMFVNRTELGTPGSFDALDTSQAILDAVRQQLGAEYADAMKALLERNKTSNAKVIEHQPSESEQDSQIIDVDPIRD